MSHMTSYILCAQESARCVPDPFFTCVVGSGNETIEFVKVFSLDNFQLYGIIYSKVLVLSIVILQTLQMVLAAQYSI